MPRSARAGFLSRRSRGRQPAGLLASTVLVWSAVALGAALPMAAAPVSSACRSSSADGQACVYAGRPLAEALFELRGRGLNLIFSSDLVRADLIVATEPQAGPARLILDRLLTPFGLEARDGPAGTILVVRGTGSMSPAATDQEPDDAGRHGRPLSSSPILRERLRVEASRRGEVEPVIRLGRDDLAGLPAAGDDPARKLAALPGITAADRSARFSVRGGEPGEARIVLDGLEIDEPFHLQDFAAFSSIVDGATIDHVDVLTGTFPAEYGDVAGGVVDLATIDTSESGRAVAGISTINAGFLSGGRLGTGGDGSWLVSGRSWRPDVLVDSVAVNGDGLNPSYNDFLGKLQFRLPGGSLLSAHLLASQDTLDYRTDSGDARAAAADDHLYTWVNVKTPWTPRLYSHTLLSSARASRTRHGASSDPLDGTTRVDDARSWGSVAIRQDWIFDAGERSSLKWGFDLRRLEAEYAYRSHVERVDTPAPSPAGGAAIDRDFLLEPAGDEGGIYLAGRLRVAARLTIEAGVRRDRHGLARGSGTSPRLNVAWNLGERTILKSGWGLFDQPQGIHDLQIEDGVVRFSPVPRDEQRQIDLEHLFRGGLRLGLSIYDTEISRPRPRFENLFNPFQLFPESGPDRSRIAPRRARARGIEIDLGSERRRALTWRASYALASAEDESAGAWVPRSWDQRHTVTFNLDFRPREAWEVSLLGLYHTGWPTTEVRAEQVLNPDGSAGIRPILGPRNALRYPPYHRLDLKISRRFSIGDGRLALYLEVTNLYGRRNVCCADDFSYLPQPDGSVRVERTDGAWLRQLPVVGLTWDF